jgi:hypothetical protein
MDASSTVDIHLANFTLFYGLFEKVQLRSRYFTGRHSHFTDILYLYTASFELCGREESHLAPISEPVAGT